MKGEIFIIEISNKEAEVVKAAYKLLLDYKLNYDEIDLLLLRGDRLLSGVLEDRVSSVIHKIQNALKIMIYTDVELKNAYRENATEVIAQIKKYREQLLNNEYAKDLVTVIDELLFITEKNDEITKLYDSIKDKIDNAKLEISVRI